MSKQQVLLQIASEIRQLSKEVKALQRALFQPPSVSTAPTKEKEKEKDKDKDKDKEKDKSASTDAKIVSDVEDSKEAMIEQQTKLEEEKRRNELKYEQASGAPYDAPGEHKVLDFCELLYEEIDRQDRRSLHFLQKFYDAQATQHIVGMGNISNKEDIATSILRKFEGIRTKHSIHKLEIDPDANKKLLLSAKLTVHVKVEDDKPRKVLLLLDFVKSKETIPFDYVIKSETIVVTDARPLFYFPELPPPVSKSAHVAAMDDKDEEKLGDSEDKTQNDANGEENSDEEEGDEDEEDDDDDDEDGEDEEADEEEGEGEGDEEER